MTCVVGVSIGSRGSSGSLQSWRVNFLFIISFAGQMILGIVSITVPIYADILGASPFMIGVIGAVGGLIYSIVPFLSGSLSERLSRKIFISISLILYSVSCILYSLAVDPVILVFVRVLEWFAIGCFWSPLEALIADSADGEFNEALRRFNVSWGLAMIVGPMIGGVLISWFDARAPFYLVSAIAAPIGILSYLIIVEPEKDRAVFSVKESMRLIGSGEGRGYVISALLMVFLFSVVGGVISSLFPAYAVNLGIQAYEVGFLMFLYGLTRAVTFYNSAGVMFMIGELRLFPFGSSLLALTSALLLVSRTMLSFSFCFILLGFGMALSYASAISSVLRAGEKFRGYASGMFESLLGFGYFIGPLIGGFLSEYALYMPYLYLLIISLAVLVVQLIVVIKRK